MQTNRLNSVALIALLVLGSTRFSLSNQRITKRADDPWFLEKSAWPQMPYDFGYEIRDLEGNEQYRNERHDGHRVTGSYGYFGPDGIYRHVDYVADERGFRAQIRTSEPGVSNQNPANVKMIVEPLLPQRVPPPGGRIHRPLGGTGGFDPTVLGDPVLESGLTIPPVRDGPIAISNTVDTGRTSSTAHHSSGLGSSQPLPPSGPSDIGSRSPLSSLEPGSPPPPSSSSSGNKLPGGRPLPRPIEIDPLRSRLPGRNPALQLPGGRPSGGSSSSSSGSLGGPIDDLFSGRDPHLSRPARPSTTRPSEYLPELSERDRSLDREMAGYPNQHSATKGGRLPVTYQHDFAKRVDTKQSSGAMEEADTSTNSKADENSTKTSGADSQPSTRESSEPDRSNGRRSDSTSGASNSEMGSTKTSPRPTEPIQPMMKMYFTEGTAAAAAVNSNSDLKSSNRLDSDNAKHSNSNEGSGAEVERIVSGSVGGIKGKLVHEQGFGQGQGLGQGQVTSYSPSSLRNPRHYSYRSDSYSSDKDLSQWSAQPRYPFQPTVSYATSRYPSNADWRAERIAQQRPISYVNPKTYERSYRRNSDEAKKPEIVVSSNLIEFPTALYNQRQPSELVNSNILRIH